MIFLASPYSHPDATIRQTRFEKARDYLRWHVANPSKVVYGGAIFSPIVYAHDLAIRGEFPLDHEFWLAFNLDILRHADMLMVLTLDGWAESKGIRVERDTARHLGIPEVMVAEMEDA